MSKLKFNVVHSRCTGTDNAGKKQYQSTTIGAVIEINGRLVLKLNYMPPAGELCNLWAPKAKEPTAELTAEASTEGLENV